MAVVCVRIDDRLIHGQVVEAWLPFLKAKRVIVISDSASRDDMQKSLMQLAMPEEVDLEIFPLKDSVHTIRLAQASSDRVLVLVPGPAEVLYLLKNGVKIGTVNVGGLHYAAGRVQLGKAIFINDNDAAALKEIVAMGVRLEGKAVPSEMASDVTSLIRGKA